MKKSIATILTLTFLASSNSAWASNFEAHCPNHENKLKDCQINVTSDRLAIEYDEKQNQDLNVDVGKKQITALSYGAYAKRRLVSTGIATILLGPIGLFGLLSKKKREQIGIEYSDNQGKKKAILVDVKKSQGFALRKELEALTGQKFLREE